MTYQPVSPINDLPTLPRLPAWVTSAAGESPENVAFLSGATLTVLDMLVQDENGTVPQKLLANRLALKAATATSKLEGRLAREADIRDAYHLTAPGEARGPDGDLLAYWREASLLRLNGPNWRANLHEVIGSDFEIELDDLIDPAVTQALSQGPLAGCTSVLHAVLSVDSRAERIACLLSDLVLARALSWSAVLPITAQRLTKALLRDLIAGEHGAEVTVQVRILDSVQDTIGVARDLARRAAALNAIAPKLRAKGSEAAVDLFLTEDAVAPATVLSPTIRGTTTPMTDRAARRFCDRLVEVGVARELTGRPTFRLYGIAA